jgi:hypothetical protein
MNASPQFPADDGAPSLPVGYADWKKSSASPVLLASLAELGRIAALGTTTHQLLTELVQLTTLATTVDGAGTMSCPEVGNRVNFVHADSTRTTKVDRLQDQLQQGPCHVSVQTRQPLAVRDFADVTAARQWPQLAASALDVGLHSALAVPLLARGRVWGILNVYRNQPHNWTFADLLISKTLADLAASLLVLTTDVERGRTHPRACPALPVAGRIVPEKPPIIVKGEDDQRADLLRAIVDARIERLNKRLSTARAQLPRQVVHRQG